ncbi:HPP family protein [Kroppenstedtia eburnea]|uniref:CBS domain-containing protein n=1 Tax=Kroppenstedtia eburnea TaxID=714067 RepID=A0A1N7NIC6_9BACL|nr:CBS domain-containing protein [Kroppenstedtia eburnea]QKI80959.1 CBS domain-containing protein [Kroppenstedtia eburnea]SIS98145.1 CBS domain-containing protein [Kroppenstedtia eburnea]
MFIRNCMTPRSQLTTVPVDATIQETLDLLEEQGLESAPVVDGQGRLAGVTGYKSIFQSLLHQKGWESSFRTQPITPAVEPIQSLHLDSDFEETLPLVIRHPFVPIVDKKDSTLAGIVKISDIESAMAIAMGYGVKGIRILLGVVTDSPYTLEHLLEALKPYQVNIISVTTFDAGEAAARRILLKLAPTPKVKAIREKLNRRGFRTLSVKQT